MISKIELSDDQLKDIQFYVCKESEFVKHHGIGSFEIVDTDGNRVDIDQGEMIAYMKRKVAACLKIDTSSVRFQVSEHAAPAYNLIKFAAFAKLEGMILTYAFLYDPQTKAATICEAWR